MPLTPTQRFARAQDCDGVQLSLSRAEFERLKAQEWLTERGENKYAAFRGMPELEGALVYYQRKLAGEISAGPGLPGSAATRDYNGEIKAIKGEISRRRRASEKKSGTPKRKRKSHGRPRNMQPSLPFRGDESRLSDSPDIDGNKRDQHV